MNPSANMQLSVASSADENWSDKIEKFGGNLFHTPQWAEAKRSTHSRCRYFKFYGPNSACCGIALGIESWSPVPLIGKFSRQLEFETYPVVADDRHDMVHALMQGIVAYARKTGCRQVVFNSYMSRTILPQPLELGMETTARIEFVIDLAMSDDDLQARFSTHHKRKIKKARKHDLVFSEYQDLDAMRRFRKLQKRSRDRRLERGEEMAVMDDGYYEELGKRYFSSDLGTVFMLSHAGRPVSAAFVAHYGTEALYMYGGSTDLGFQMDAPPLLFSKIFACFRERGYHLFNLGGVPAEAEQPGAPSHGLYRFKAGFGGEQRICRNAVVRNLNPGREKLLHLAKRLIKPAG